MTVCKWVQVLKCLSRDPRRRPTAVQLLHAWDNIFDHVQTHGTDWGHTPSDALTSTAATVPPAATSSTTPRTHTYANTQTLSGSPPLCSLPVGSSPQGTSQCDAFANHTGTHTNAQQHTDSGHPAHGTGAVVTQQFLGETAATAATSPPITRHEEVDTESVSSEASPRDVNNTAPLGTPSCLLNSNREGVAGAFERFSTARMCLKATETLCDY